VTIPLSNTSKVTFEKSSFMIGPKMQFQSDIEFEQNLTVIHSFGISNFNTLTQGVHFVITITTILVILNAKNLILGIMIVSNAMLHVLHVQVQTLFSAFLVMIQIIISMTEEQCVQKPAGMENC